MKNGDYLQCKVVCIGSSGSGKTSLINRYIYNSFSSVLTSTPGASFSTKNIDIESIKGKIKFEIWDTAGKKKYRALAKVFYENAQFCILVYDITNRSSFEELKNYWVNDIKANANPNISN